MRVIATQKGYYGGVVREPGDTFVLANPEAEFSDRWMIEAERDPLDHDGDGRKGGSKPRRRAQEQETEVKAPEDPAPAVDPVTGDEI